MHLHSSYGQNYQTFFNSIYPELADEYEIFINPFLIEGIAFDANLNQPDGKHPKSKGLALISKKIAENIKKIIN